MRKMTIFDPAMCCPTGICGPSIDPELLRVSRVINRLKRSDVIVERHNLTNNPMIFVNNKVINEILTEEGVEVLPITMVDGEIVKTKSYPTDEEFVKFLDIPEDYLKLTIKQSPKID
ncbi:arsenite efflux transporter metallochaperone ArsD [Proteiniborus sp. MB09-C3]|uniref:arsenite efflux transporter metallochaperone ArsD n=1 Tax=Proteiniborus sp. MB09-C3 TaxID=3050072 RepID=UPI002554EF8E|nr:arsenite efflux transporter metallochaperone ArsD [Proteiniborus sp. MB09-C3]WIV13959.1 arsenite efflux transporter metallochaperone ArsD [Proteiniborus sp. MB09-C3]